ncbi:MAG: ABC transporter ATP-binding protein [Syntrophomonadaceae bacterium]
MDKAVFSLRGVEFSYQNSNPLLSGLNLDIYYGNSVCLLGANGSGKSTVLKMLCALLFPTRGSFKAFGDEISEALMENDRYAKEYRRRVGFVFQNSEAQLFTTRIWDEIAFGPLQLGLAAHDVRQRVEDIAHLLRIDDLLERSPYRLSGGEKKKVALACVLVMNPEVLILDEPTNGLDPKTQRWLTEILLELNDAGRTIITATHNLELAHAISKRAVVLSEEHQLVCDGKTFEILGNRDLLIQVNLIDEYTHIHESHKHTHRFMHA